MAPADARDRRGPRDRGARDPGPRDRSGPRDRRTDVLVAVGTAVVALGLLLGLPPLDAADPDGAGVSSELAATLGSGATYPAVGGTAWIVLAVGLLAQSAAVLAARRAPRTTLLVVAAVPVVVATAAPSTLFGLTALPVVVAVVLAALRVPLPRLWPAVVGAAALVAAGTGVNGAAADVAGSAQSVAGATGQGVLQAVGAVGIPLVVALLVRSRREVRTARTAEATAVDREQDALVEAAVSRERAAMARELHDIAAHHLSGIALMSAVIDRQIDADPERAHEGVRQVREQSTAVLEDLRRLVGLLREDAPAARSVETVAGIVDLVERSRLRTAVVLDVLPGDHPLADGIGPLTQLAAYRTVQESLANVALHAPGAPCTVTVDDRDPDHLDIRVENGAATVPAVGSGPAGGNGLRGMRERADLVGARLQVGPTATGGWVVTLRTSREARPATDGSADGSGVAR
ncbi:Signal transduction histidine kinase [Curtobacterium sp. UNCCL20]|uniref:sensor histidine kinase n=1 Tax=Curtobacterium sp. UNCCL20 TaxID=1502773 RepID=UPI00088D6A4D|nr:histidine kinase [Curtobacterium sp. UNCCL20]SDQ85949.1 Signal transduction histidine kinase [Curtobacterium sp. UNCCL20]